MIHKINSMVDCYEGDALATLKQLPSESVQCVVTSPPYYGLRDYGVDGQMGLEETPDKYVEKMVEVFREVRRVLRLDGVAWLNLGDSYAGTGKSGGGKQGERWSECGMDKEGPKGGKWQPPPNGLKQKDLIGIPWRVVFALQSDGADTKAMATIGRARDAIVDAYSGETLPDKALKALENLMREYAGAKGSSWWLRQDIIWNKPSPMPESVTDRCTKAHEYVFLLAKSEKYFFDAEAIKEPASNTSGWAKQRSKGINTWKYNDNESRKKQTGQKIEYSTFGDGQTRNKRSVWTITTKPFKEAHFATMPPDLAEICIKAGTSEKGCCPNCGKPWVRIISKDRVATRPGNDTKVTGDSMVDGNRDPQRHVTTTETVGWKQSCQCNKHEPVPCLVLDPFGGAATTGLVASRLDRRCTLIELNPKYIDIMKSRLKEDPSIFDVGDNKESN